MAWTSLVITLLAHFTGAISQAVVTQEPSLTTTPGGTVTFTCGSRTGPVTTSNYAKWVQEKSYQVHTGLIGDTSIRVPGVPARFSGSLLGDKAALTITGAKPEDEAVYYCALWYSDHWVFGGGTKVTVLGQPSAAPSVTLFPPSSEELKTNQATLVCMIKEFYPSDVKVTWESDGIPITQGVKTTQPSKRDNKYLATSFLTMTAEAWKSRNSISCQVTHGGTTVEKSLSPAACF
ncbi:Ig lambda-1 chain V region H2020 isoform X9 [Mesocricetus auratus]|uniref:Ig lambda-1 chain V region H2020 isoform X9 n=1 Tax=Mesocricetus auratus TaxID=10036 RepID=A0ABM2XWK4_MESAU|nr:Ig lambda-1 chain V region H2020 isoform X9 [Mesocricetus auratus]